MFDRIIVLPNLTIPADTQIPLSEGTIIFTSGMQLQTIKKTYCSQDIRRGIPSRMKNPIPENTILIFSKTFTNMIGTYFVTSFNNQEYYIDPKNLKILD
jgi:hypothetical protein